MDEPLIQATTYIPLMDNSDTGTLEKREVVEAAKQNVNEGIQKSSGKKLKNETDKGKKLAMQSVSSRACLQTSSGKTCRKHAVYVGRRNLLLFARKKRLEGNVRGCRTLFVLVCAHFSSIFGTVERSLCHLNPINADCRLLCPRSEQMGDGRPHRCMRASLTVMDSSFQHGLLESA